VTLSSEKIRLLRDRIRQFEDRKINGGDLSRDVFYVAREIAAVEEAPLRRALEKYGNKLSVLVERGSTQPGYQEILEVVDELESELVEWGY